MKSRAINLQNPGFFWPELSLPLICLEKKKQLLQVATEGPVTGSQPTTMCSQVGVRIWAIRILYAFWHHNWHFPQVRVDEPSNLGASNCWTKPYLCPQYYMTSLNPANHTSQSFAHCPWLLMIVVYLVAISPVNACKCSIHLNSSCWNILNKSLQFQPFRNTLSSTSTITSLSKRAISPLFQSPHHPTVWVGHCQS